MVSAPAGISAARQLCDYIRSPARAGSAALLAQDEPAPHVQSVTVK